MSVPAPIVKVRPRVTPTELQFWWSPPGKWVVGGGVTDSIATSTDGLTWSLSTNNPFTGGSTQGIAWNGSYWVAVGNSSSQTVCIAKSTDGLTWTNSTNNPFTGGAGNGIAWNGTYWVAVGYNSDNSVCIAKSTDGMTWTDSITGGGNNPFITAKGIAWNGSYWIAVGFNNDNTVSIAKSTDGITWTNATDNPFSGNQGTGIAWNGSYWVAVGLNSSYTVCIAKSTDGLTWTNSTNNPFSGEIGRGIAWNGSYWIAGGNNPGGSVCIAKSTDGLTWTPSSNNPFTGGTCNGISWSAYDSYWIAVGANTSGSVTIAKSTDGLIWTPSTNNPFPAGTSYGIANSFIAITGYVLESVSPSVTQTVGPSTTTTTISGLTNLTDYSFTIKTDISGSYSSTIPFRTVRTSAKPGPVATLTKSQSIVGGLLTVTFTWTNPGDYAYYYVYGLRIATGTRDTIYKGTFDYSTLSHTFTGLDPVRTYKFNIQRGNDAGYSTITSLITTSVFFDPTTVTGLYFWADATDVSGNGATVADGSVVATWKDKSGTSNNATATTGATVQTDSVGRYLNFTGSSWYSLAESSWVYNEYFTFFVVDKPVNYSGSYTLISNQASSTDSLIITYNTADGIRLSTDGDNAALGNAFQGVTAPVNIWCFTNYGGKTAYWNKLISGKATTPAAFITDSLLSIGAVQGSTNLYNGRMREILMYRGVMSETNREAITIYLYNKWFTQPNTIPQNPVENSTVLWLDAQDITTFFQDLSGTIPVTEDNQTVLRWKDKSGFGNDIECIDVLPKYNTGVINNLPTFDTSAVGGIIQTNNYLQTGDATLFLVALTGSTPPFYFVHDSLNNFGLTNTNALSWRESGTENNNRFTDTENPFIFYGTMQKGQLLTGTFIDSAGIQTSYTIDTLTMTVSIAPIKLCTSGRVYYGEVIYYNRALTDAEIQTNAVYLSNKWGIAIPPVVAFSPQQISGMKIWLDAADPYTLFQSGGAVTIWKDKSGNGNNAVPHGSPTVNNGIVFDGSGQWLSLPDGALPQDKYSYYIVSKLAGDSAIISGGSNDISGQMWVAVGYGGGIRISFDGLRWINSATPFSGGNGNGIAWNGSYWVAVGNNSDFTVTIATSTNGMTWTASTGNPFSGAFGKGIAWNGTYWVAVGYNSGATVAIATSTDGDTWTNATDNPFSGGQGNGIAWSASGSYWVAVGFNSSSTVCIAKSTDGDTWTDASNNPFSGGQGKGIAWNGTYWVAVGQNSDNTVTIAKSTDGMTWTDASNNLFVTGNGIAWNGVAWVAVGANGSGTVTIIKSTDGMTWTASTNNPFSGAQAFGIAWSTSGSYWVAVGYNAGSTVGVAISTDGLIWTPSINNPYISTWGLGIASGIAPIHNSITTITATTVPETTTYLAKTTFDNISGVSPLEDTNIIPNDTTVIIESIYDGANKSLYLSGITGATDTSSHSQDASNNLIGKDLSGNYMNGTIKEILVYNTAHTAEQREQIELYLKNKWYSDTYTPTETTLWLDSSSASNFTLSGSSVQVWKDKSAQATNYSQAYKWAQPLYSLDPVTLKYGVRFGADAITTGLTSTTSPFGATNSWSVFAVQRYDYSTNIYTEETAGHVCTAYKAVHTDLVPGWVAVGANLPFTNSISVSTDGMRWGFADNSFPSGGRGIAWNGSYWVAVGETVNTSVAIAKSTDGMTWTASTNNPFSDGAGYGIAWSASGSYWVAVGLNSAQTVTILKSTDGMTWTASTNNPFAGGQGQGIAWNGSYWVAVGYNLDQTVSIAKSTDGLTWTASTTNPFYYGLGIAWNGSYWIAVGYSANQAVCIAKSTDGMTWTESTDNPFSGGAGFGIAWNGSYWVAVGYNSDQTVCIAKSTDGMTWTNSTNNPFPVGFGRGIAWNGSYWLAVGIDGTVGNSTAKSTDGMSWTISTDDALSIRGGYGIAYGNIRPGSVISCGTGKVTTPNVNELKMIVGVTSTPAGVEIHKRPVLTSQIVNELVYDDFYNGTTNAEDVAVGQAMTTNIKLNIGYKEAVSPALKGAMRGYIYELIVFNTAITTEVRQSVEGYLAWKWGIQDLLVSTHPYYLAPP